MFGYVRVSGKGQVDGDGFDRQEKVIIDFAKANNLIIERVFREEGISVKGDILYSSCQGEIKGDVVH